MPVSDPFFLGRLPWISRSILLHTKATPDPFFFCCRLLSFPSSAFSTAAPTFFGGDRGHFFPLLVALVDAIVFFPHGGRDAETGLGEGVDLATDLGELVYLCYVGERGPVVDHVGTSTR